MTRGQRVLLGLGLLVLGVTWFIISAFNMKHDIAWLSVSITSIMSAVTGGIILSDNGSVL